MKDSYIENFTYILDYNNTYFEPSEPEEPSLKKVSDVIATIGVVLTGIILLHLIIIMIWFPERRRLPRMWILLGILAAHFIHLIMINVQEGLVRSIHDTGSGNTALCTFLSGIRPTLECASVFGSGLLAYHVFLWVYAPDSSRGRRALIFWVTAVVLSWLLGTAFGFGTYGADAKLEEFTGVRPRRIACFVEEDAIRPVFYSSVTFLLPYMLAFPPTYAALGVLCLKADRVTTDLKEHYTQPREGPSRIESSGAVIIPDPEKVEPSQSNNDSRTCVLLWVIFNIANVFFGACLRVLMHLMQHESFRPIDFWESMFLFFLALLLSYIYLCVMPLVCLLLPELRCGIIEKITSCFKR